MRVLIVDDSIYMRTSLRNILERNGFNVIGEAESGLEAVKQYNLLNPDIITMDITMPDMDGIAAVKEIKKINSGAKIIMISAMGKESMVMESIKSGAVSFIVKPFKEESVLSIFNKIMNSNL